MNNVQYMRVKLSGLFEDMNGEKLDKDAADSLNELQQLLTQLADDLAFQFIQR